VARGRVNGTAPRQLRELLRGLRESKGLTQEGLAHKAGVSDKTIRHCESGEHWPRRSTIDQLADALELGADEREAMVTAWRGEHQPCSLPSDIPDFVGRATALALAEHALDGGEEPGATRICVLTGMGGVGKTTMAVHLAHGLAKAYPDGQLYVDLRGSRSDPVRPAEALARFLELLGTPRARLPDDLDARSGLLRDRLAGRRFLLVLDDAGAESQVRPLLPGTPSSAVLVTSRSRLHGLSGAGLVCLCVLDHEEALDLLAGVIGQARVLAEPDAASTVVRLCGHLPLAVRVVAGLLAGRPEWRVEHVADLLADERRRLDVLKAGDLCVSATISLSYCDLPAPVRAAFRLLSVLDAPDFAAWVGCVVADLSHDAASRTAEKLVDAHLLEIVGTDDGGQVRYQFHDLVRAYARHHDEDDGRQRRREVLRRVIRVALVLTRRATRDAGLGAAPAGVEVGKPGGCAQRLAAAEPDGAAPAGVEAGGPDGGAQALVAAEPVLRTIAGAPLSWLDAERSFLVSLARQAAMAGLLTEAAQLTWELAGYCSLRCDFASWQVMAQTVHEAARRSGDQAAEASAGLALADVLLEQGDLAGGRDLASAALLLARRHRLHGLEVRAMLTTAIIARSTGEPAVAGARLVEVAAAADAIGDRLARAYALSELGSVHAAMGDPDKAEQQYRLAQAIFAEHGELRGQAKVALRRAILAHSRADLRAARNGFSEAFRLARLGGDLRATVEIQYRLGKLLLGSGEQQAAAELFRQAASSSRQVGDARGHALASEALGEAYTAIGDRWRARQALEVALRYYRHARLRAGEQDVRLRLGRLG